MRYLVENPDISQLNENLQKYIEIHTKKFYIYQVRCVLKVNDSQYLTCTPTMNLDYTRSPNIIS